MHSGDFAAAALDIHRGIGLTGPPDAINVPWPQAVMQLCVVHLIRASLRYASRKYWAPPPHNLVLSTRPATRPPRPPRWTHSPPLCSRATPAIVRLWRAHWAEFTPFPAFPPEVRKVIYTTNPIGELMNARLRKVTRNRGQFPPDRPPSKSSTSRSATWRNSAVATWESAAPDVTIKVEIDGPSLA